MLVFIAIKNAFLRFAWYISEPWLLKWLLNNIVLGSPIKRCAKWVYKVERECTLTTFTFVCVSVVVVCVAAGDLAIRRKRAAEWVSARLPPSSREQGPSVRSIPTTYFHWAPMMSQHNLSGLSAGEPRRFFVSSRSKFEFGALVWLYFFYGEGFSWKVTGSLGGFIC